MIVVGRSLLDTFCLTHADARSRIGRWLAETEASTWVTPQQIKDRYASVSFLSDNRVIFNVKGNDYRMEVTVAYKSRTVVVKWIGTHAEYDQRNR